MKWLRFVQILAVILIAVAVFTAMPRMLEVKETGETAAKLEMKVYQTPWCGCCSKYIEYLKRKGFRVEVVTVTDLTSIKNELGVPKELWSCHTGVLGDYIVEGHVPVEAIDKLLTDKPKVDGIAVPGMPAGAPGMNGRPEPITVYWFRGHETGVFMVVKPDLG